MNQHKLTSLPQIEVLLGIPEVQHYSECLGRPVVADIVRATIDTIRQSVLNGRSEMPQFDQIIGKVISA